MDDRIPETQPSGGLVPPPRHPPTAVGASAPLAPRPRPELPRRISGLVDAVLDQLDHFGDRIANAVGLR